MLILLAAAQAVASVPADPPEVRLNKPVVAGPCDGQTSDGEIVVCGRRDQPYRLRPTMGPEFKERPPKAEFKLSENSELSFHGESGLFGAPRAMVTFKLRF